MKLPTFDKFFGVLSHPLYALLLLTSLLLVACGHDYENTSKQKELFNARQAQALDTLICVLGSGTGGLDLYYLQGKLSLPTDIKIQLSDTSTRDIKVCGNFPKDFLHTTDWDYDSGLAFKIMGKPILADTENGLGKVPLFYVTEWTKFKYDSPSWQERGDLGIYPNRKKMIDGVLTYLKLKGQKLKEVERILGEPDFREENEIVYKIDEDYGTDIDPISTTNLSLKFNKDSIVTEARKEEWKKR